MPHINKPNINIVITSLRNQAVS